MIDGVGRATAARPATVGDAAARAPAMVARAGDAASVTAQAPVVSNLARVAKDLAASPPVDAARVEALRLAIASGDYKPDPARIAAAMIALETPPKG